MNDYIKTLYHSKKNKQIYINNIAKRVQRDNKFKVLFHHLNNVVIIKLFGKELSSVTSCGLVYTN